MGRKSGPNVDSIYGVKLAELGFSLMSQEIKSGQTLGEHRLHRQAKTVETNDESDPLMDCLCTCSKSGGVQI